SKGWVQLSFTSKIDADQLPLKEFSADWGYTMNGGAIMLTRTANMMERPSPDNPHVVMHFYDYNDLGSVTQTCNVDGVSGKLVTPRVQIVDNWDRYNNISDANSASRPICVLE
ncbi:MAG: hypothetical protein PHR00_04555, partial [Patescibacteria group bacterium]|nr:hypothetical protein [Patescibacteria group bacterium]